MLPHSSKPIPVSLCDTISLLAAERDPKFSNEYELRLFQFLWWLLDESDHAVSLDKAGYTFAALALAKEVSKNRRRVGVPKALILAVSDPSLQQLFETVHWTPDGFYRLLQIYRPLLHKEDFKDIRFEIEVLSNFAEAQLRIAQSGETVSDNKAYRIMKKLPSQNGVQQTRSRLFRPRQRRSARLPFIYAAFKRHAWMVQDRLGVKSASAFLSASDLIAFFRERRGGVEEMKTFLARAKGVVDLIGGPLVDQLAECWPKLEAQEPDVEPLTEEELEAIRSKRRAATETKKANRQSPAR